jgi:hypothetical protein
LDKQEQTLTWRNRPGRDGAEHYSPGSPQAHPGFAYAQELDLASGQVSMDLGSDPDHLGGTDREDLGRKAHRSILTNVLR